MQDDEHKVYLWASLQLTPKQPKQVLSRSRYLLQKVMFVPDPFLHTKFNLILLIIQIEFSYDPYVYISPFLTPLSSPLSQLLSLCTRGQREEGTVACNKNIIFRPLQTENEKSHNIFFDKSAYFISDLRTRVRVSINYITWLHYPINQSADITVHIILASFDETAVE